VPPRWSAAGLAVTALGSFAVAVAASIAAVLALGLLAQPLERWSPAHILVITAATDGALLLALFGLGRWLIGLTPGALGLRRPRREDLRQAVRVAAVLWLLSILINALQVRVFGPHPQQLVVSLGAHSGATAFALDLVTAAAVAPLAEEILFRGLIFGGLAQRLPAAWAAVLSAGLFAVSHGVGVAVPIFVLGLGLAYVYWRTRTLWAAIAAHSLVNAVSIALIFVLPRGVLDV